VVILMIIGLMIYFGPASPQCKENGPLHVWFYGFLVLQFMWPFCMPSLTLLILGWCLGAVLLVPQNGKCQQLHQFLFEAVIGQSLQAILLIIAAGVALKSRPLVQQLNDLIGNGGTDPEVVQHIAVVPTSEVPSDEECVICLSRDDSDGVSWRQLVCGHRFHEPCLLEWLGKANKCPICRLDLHEAHRVEIENLA